MSGRIRSVARSADGRSVLLMILDGVLIGVAYLLAFWLRFDGLPAHGVDGQYVHLFDDTIWWVVPVMLVALIAFGVYKPLPTRAGRREFEQIVKASVAAMLLVIGATAVFHPTDAWHPAHAMPTHFIRVSVQLPASVAVLFLLLMLALLGGTRLATHLVTQGGESDGESPQVSPT